jgi:hypothetical protein
MNAPTNVVGMREVAPAAPKPRARTKSPAPAAAARAERKAAVKANAQEVQAQQWSAGLLGGVAAVLTGLSLSHLAHGIEVSWPPRELACRDHDRQGFRATPYGATLEPLWNLLPGNNQTSPCLARKFLRECRGLLGGRTRTRTLDPLIKSQLLMS